MAGAVLAHQGGLDELFLVALPIGLFAGLLYLANRRAQARLDVEERDQLAGPGEGDA